MSNKTNTPTQSSTAQTPTEIDLKVLEEFCNKQMYKRAIEEQLHYSEILKAYGAIPVKTFKNKIKTFLNKSVKRIKGLI